MIIKQYLKLTFCILLFCLGSSKLTYVSTVLRHGARYPVTNIYDGNQTAPFHGQLTTIGMRQHYLLGGYLRSDYIIKAKLLNESLYPKQIQIFADQSERCIQSTICHVLGLYPFSTGATIPQGIDKNLLDPPFESMFKNDLLRRENGQFALESGFQTVPYKNASQFFPSCPKSAQILAKRMKEISSSLAKLQLEMTPFIQKMKLIFKLPVDLMNIFGMADLFDVVECDRYLGRQLPQQFTNYDYSQLRFIHDFIFASIYEGQMSKIYATSVVSGILANMDNVVKKGKDEVKKFSIYSGHDINVVPVMMFFNLTNPSCIEKSWKNETVEGNCAQIPPFASNFILQLHENDEKSGDYFVKIRYNGLYFNCWNNTKECPYQEFVQKAKSNFVDVKKQCGLKKEELVEE